MSNIMLMSLLILLIANIMMTLCLVLSKKSLFDREKYSSFECGFDQKSSSRLPFSLQFFLIAIIFLIFDVEITLLLPALTNSASSTWTSWLSMNSMFLSILIVGIIYEWSSGLLEWKS